MMVCISYVCCVLVNRGMYVVYGGIIIIEYDYFFVFYVDEVSCVFFQFYYMVCVRDQEWQGFVYVRC